LCLLGDIFVENSEADWNDENSRIVCEIFADEVEKGNRANAHLNKAGYKNVIQRFKDRTGIEYTRKQFKNKWDKLKGDYGIWKKLTNNETGIGWDETKKNIDMPESWWKKAIKVSSFQMYWHFKFLSMFMNITLICCITGH